MFEIITDSIRNIGHFSNEEMTFIKERLQPLSCKKQSVLIKNGEMCKAFYFINRGSFRQYFITDDGNESIVNLFTQGDWMLEYKSFTSQRPSETIIEATQDSELLLMTIQDVHELIQLSNSFFALGRILENGLQNQLYQGNRLTPEEKYNMLLEQKPQLIQTFPAKYIASYLCITPETLSRVRRKLIS